MSAARADRERERLRQAHGGGEFPTKGRAGKGVIAMASSERNGRLVGALQVFPGDELMLISNQGTLVRTRADEVSVLGRNTQGVRIIRTKAGEQLVSVERIADSDEESRAPETLPAADRDAPRRRETTDGTGLHNFCAGPAALPEAVLERAAAELLDWHGSGMSFMEMSHRSKAVVDVVAEAEASLRRLLRIGDEFAVLFTQGGRQRAVLRRAAQSRAQLDGLRLRQHGAVVAQGHEGSLALR
jgi:hypothetical protein